jgi:hypothetical protein
VHPAARTRRERRRLRSMTESSTEPGPATRL